MRELEKIGEAKYFYSQMSVASDNRDRFKYNLSAFLSSARSVLQHALEEAKSKNGGQGWYDLQISGNFIVSFFKDKRDFNIHTGPVAVRKDVDLKLSETVSISDSIHIVLRNSEGNIQGSYDSDLNKARQKAGEPPEIETKYRFDDWIGDEDVFVLCQKYLRELENIIADGRKKGFLS